MSGRESNNVRVVVVVVEPGLSAKKREIKYEICQFFLLHCPVEPGRRKIREKLHA